MIHDHKSLDTMEQGGDFPITKGNQIPLVIVSLIITRDQTRSKFYIRVHEN